MKKPCGITATIILFLLLGGCFSLSWAGQVTLELSATTGVENGEITAGFNITNKGTDTAHEVEILAKFFTEQHQVFIAERLGPGQSAEAKISFDLPENLYGSYPVYITILYQHADGISVSSASLAHVVIGAPGKNTLQAEAVLDGAARKGEVSLEIETEDRSVHSVSVTGHAPDDLSLAPLARKVSLQDGKGAAAFTVKNVSGNEGSTYGVFFAVEYKSEGVHNLATAQVAVPVESAPGETSLEAEKIHTALYAAVLLMAALLFIGVILSTKIRRWLFSIDNIPQILDILVLLAVEVFIFSKIDLPSLFTATVTTGGDTASHYYTLEYLRHTLLPAGNISGWTMGNYAGFPILQFYFPLPFLVMCLLDLVMPLQVAFKLGTLLGTAMLPVASYTMLRLLRCPFPGPGLGAAFMLPFLFNSANSMWGGNILSTLAGEFSYSFSMALSLVLIGSLYRGALEDKWIIRNAVLVFLVGFSHGYTLLFAEAVSLFLLITPYGFSKRAFYLFRVYALGFCLLAFWLVPLLVFTKYTTSYHLVWTIYSIKEVVPDILLPFVATGLAGSIILVPLGLMTLHNSGAKLLSVLAYLWFGLAAAVVFFVAAPRIGVVDIRYVPYGQLMLCLMAALALGWISRSFLNRRGLNWLVLIAATAGTIYWTGDRVGPVTGWTKWNYEGFEAKRAWTVFEKINRVLAGDFQDPRVVFEHSQDHNMFGSTRAFESLPLFAGRATLEGLYMQASISAPFVFYIQSMVSRESSQPFPQYSYTKMDLARARDYLKLFNVNNLVIKSSAAKQSLRQVDGYTRIKNIGQYEIWELTSGGARYVEPLPNKPVAYRGAEPWKEVAHRWFSRDNLHDVHLVFNAEGMGKNDGPLALTTHSLDELPRHSLDISGCNVAETIKAQEILLQTSCPGKPHLVKVSYHPNWQVEGAAKIFLASPSFMLIYPQKENVRLYYGSGPWNRLGQLMTFCGLFVLLLHIPLPGKKGQTAWLMVAKRFRDPVSLLENLLPDPNPSARKTTMLVILLAALLVIAAGSYHTYINEPYRGYNKSIRYKDAAQYEQARKGFRKFITEYPLANLARESSYYIGITYYLEKKDAEAIKAFEEYIERYPQGNRIAEVQYHLGLLLLRSGDKQAGTARMRLVAEKFSGTPWATYARERLQEQTVTPPANMLNINESNLQRHMGLAINYFNRDMLDKAKPLLKEISER
ncbi:MAG: 6-pyruvoyl-tetrahydropterin synthase-related protein, partial [Desulfobulbales bacterium]|nr:6-pyruvoyl-tetrahydropterin synthase-related protein [Desulfobulbales bacterium]